MEITVGEILFLDTNILLIATDESRKYHQLATRVIATHNRGGIHLGISGQIIREYLVVATRIPDVNGLGLSPDEALSNIEVFRQRLVFFDETEAVSNKLRSLIGSYQLTGKRIHDANVAATMLTHSLSKLITENPGDFSVFSDVETVGLAEISQFINAAD
jgi:predicted nucleic acid-binding protein